MTGGLTRMQAAALNFIKGYIAKNGYSPTYAEIAADLGLASKSSVNRLVTALEQRGRVRKAGCRARGIEVIEGAEFHLKRILVAIEVTGSAHISDPIVAEALLALGRNEL